LTTFNAKSVTATKIYRTIRDKVIQETGMSNEAVKSIVGPLVERHINETKKRQQALDITKSLLQQDTITNLPKLMVVDGVVVEADPQAKKIKEPKTRTKLPKGMDEAAVKDATSLMEFFRRSKHEHNLTIPSMAKVMGISTSSVNNWLTRESTIPRKAGREIIASFLSQFSYELPARYL
jgi:DNA-binding transcriptional regulator YiaG